MRSAISAKKRAKVLLFFDMCKFFLLFYAFLVHFSCILNLKHEKSTFYSAFFDQ